MTTYLKLPFFHSDAFQKISDKLNGYDNFDYSDHENFDDDGEYLYEPGCQCMDCREYEVPNEDEKHYEHYMPHDYLRALRDTPTTGQTKVVILGQDPYPTPGHANGLAFSVSRHLKAFPRSLQNIFKELVNDIGVPYPEHGDLKSWAHQGVLLLNTILTVSPFRPGSHKDLGWGGLITEIFEAINKDCEDVVFILWGKYAQSYEHLIDTKKHHIIKSPHPSPFSASYGFFGSKPFSKANELLGKKRVIDWTVK